MRETWVRAIRSLGSMMVFAMLGMVGCSSQGSEATEGLGDSEARASLERLSGCFSVRYQFVETGGGKDFLVEDNIEYMDVREQGAGYFVRNFLIVDEQSSFLHWTQTWQPLGDGIWSMRVEDGQGQLRYESQGMWRFNQWEGEIALAQKPNRDIMRTDYELLERRNIIQFTPGQWIQSEVNLKLSENGTPVASEVGWIVYKLAANADACAPAMSMARPVLAGLQAR